MLNEHSGLPTDFVTRMLAPTKEQTLKFLTEVELYQLSEQRNLAPVWDDNAVPA